MSMFGPGSVRLVSFEELRAKCNRDLALMAATGKKGKQPTELAAKEPSAKRMDTGLFAEMEEE